MPEQLLDAAEGPISEAEERAELTLANSARCRTWLSQGRSAITTVAGARRHIHFTSPPDPEKPTYTKEELNQLFPFVLIGTQAEAGYTAMHESMSGTPSPFDFKEWGVILAKFWQIVPPGDLSEAQIERKFKNHLGVITRETFDLYGREEMLAVRNIQLNGPMRNHPDEIKGKADIQGFELVMTWGRQ